MRAVVQRVERASVDLIESIERVQVSAIGAGLLVLLGIRTDDTEADSRLLSAKIGGLRIFEDSEGKMNRSVLDTGGQILLVSNFTLFGDCRQGRRPSFTEAAAGPVAEPLYRLFGAELEKQSIPVQYGVFGAEMKVSLVNDGPVTLLLDSRKSF